MKVDTAHEVGGVSNWERAHRALSRLARQRAALDAEEGRCLLAALRAAAHVHLGFATFAEYVERVLGYSPRSTQEKLRVAEALEGLPVLARALEKGALSWSALRELTRVACAETERDWLQFSRGKSVRQLEEVIAGARPGDGPDSPRAPRARRHVLRFEVAPETFALFREASAHLRRHGDRAFDDDAILLSMARAVLGGPTDEGRASYQVSLSICTECGRAEQSANGTLVTVGPEIVAMASCDARHIGIVTVPANDTPRSFDAETEISANTATSAATDSETATDSDSNVTPSPTTPTPHIGRGHLADESPRPAPVRAHAGARAQRTQQTIPPALRRAILHRDHHRCYVPGCRNATFLDIHHIQPRCEGGSNDPANLIDICCAHHRAVHRGQLIIERTVSGLRFFHADGRPYGDISAPASLDIQRKVASALRNLGFRDADVREVFDQLREEGHGATDTAPRIMTTEQLLREALVRLGPRRSARR